MQFTQPNETNMPVKAPMTARYAFVPPSGTSGNSSYFGFCSGTPLVTLLCEPFSRLELSASAVGVAVGADMTSRRIGQLRIYWECRKMDVE